MMKWRMLESAGNSFRALMVPVIVQCQTHCPALWQQAPGYENISFNKLPLSGISGLVPEGGKTAGLHIVWVGLIITQPLPLQEELEATQTTVQLK